MAENGTASGSDCLSRVAWFFSFVLCGASLGWGVATAVARFEQRAGPAGWTLRTPRIPVFAAVEQPLPEGGGWPLMDHGELRGPVSPGPSAPGFSAVEPGVASAAARSAVDVPTEAGIRGVESARSGPVSPGGRVAVEARVPAGGTLEVGLDFGGALAGVHLAREATPSTRAFVRPARGAGAWLTCERELPAPGEKASAVEVRAGGDAIVVTVDGVTAACTTPAVMPRAAVIRGGLLRSLLVSVDGQEAPGVGVTGRLVGAAIGAGMLALLGWIAERRARWLAVAVGPLLAVGPLQSLDARGTLEALRVQAEPTTWLLGAPVAVAAALAAMALVWRARVATGLVIGAATAAAITAATRPESPWATVAATGVGLALAGVVLLNARRPRGFNVASLVLLASAAGLLEVGLRHTATGRSWASVPSREEAALRTEHADLTERRQFTTYPSHGYPIEPPPRTAPVRVVAFGGSSTGGAFSSDDLGTFWPALLGERLGAGVQVVNQGVGGWTTLHIRRYIETALGPVDPDVAVLYVGHNDRFTPSAVPYATLFGAWEHRPAASVSRALSELRIYQGLRFGLTVLAGRPGGQAVPVEHMRANIAAIVERLRAAGARVLLLREAVAIGGDLLHEHAQVLCSFEAEDVGCLDAASTLEDPLAGSMFLDNVHLNADGHATLATLIAAELERRGWVR